MSEKLDIIYVTKHPNQRNDSSRQAGNVLQGYGTRGVYVPEGLSVGEIMLGAEVLERDFDVTPYESRAMVRAVLLAIRSGIESAETSATRFEA